MCKDCMEFFNRSFSKGCRGILTSGFEGYDATLTCSCGTKINISIDNVNVIEKNSPTSIRITS